MVNCSVPNCRIKNEGGCGLSFHHFPSDSIMIAKWVKAISRKGGKLNPHWNPTKHSVVCSRHFKDTDYSTSTRRNILLPHAVPSVFSKETAKDKISVLEETQIDQEEEKNVYTVIPPKKKINRAKPKTKKVWLDTETIERELGLDFLNEITEDKTIKLENESEYIPVEEDTGEEYIVNEYKTEQNLEETALSTNLCRLCASPSVDVISIFENRQLKSVLLEKIHTYLPIMITAEDLLPTTVCRQCVNKLEVCHSLVQGCLDADVVLKTMFGLQNFNQVDYGIDNQVKTELTEESNVYEEYEDVNNTELPDNVNEEQTSNQFDDQNGNTEPSSAVDLDTNTKAPAVNKNVVNKKPKQVRRIKPKLKVVIVKLKNINNVTDQVELEKALQLAINEKLKQHTPALSQEHKLTEKPSVKQCTDSSAEISKLIDREQKSGQNHDKMTSDHTYTLKVYCQHCQQEFINKEELLLHQQTSKQCCKSKQALNNHSEVCYDHNNQPEDKENLKLNGSNTVNSNETVLEQAENEVTEIFSNNFKEDTVQKDMEVEVLDVDIKTDIKPGMFKLDGGCQIKFPKGFEHITSTHQSKILSAIDKIIEKKLPKPRPRAYPPRIRGPNGWECNVCHEIFPTTRVYRVHRKTHIPRPFPCTQCKRTFTSEMNLKKHLDLHSIQRTFMCEFCGKIFKFNYSLKLHYISHGKHEKIHECSECGKKFGTKHSYNQHRLRHGTANYLCDICGKSMKYPASLRNHKSLHKQKILYECATCGKKYNNSQGMKIHTQSHIREAPFGCDRCGKHFRTQFNLSEHKLSHANTTSYKCYICAKCFKFRMQLKRHITRHQLTLKYTCKQCHVTFTSMKKLLIHRRSHTSVKIENCQAEKLQLTETIS